MKTVKNSSKGKPSGNKQSSDKKARTTNPDKKKLNKNQRRYFDASKPFPKNPKSHVKSVGTSGTVSKSKKIQFDEDVSATESATEIQEKEYAKPKPQNSNYKSSRKVTSKDDSSEAWHLSYSKYNTNADLVELKESELKSLTETCKSSFDSLQTSFLKKNPSDAKWLHTALQKGTAKDRVNSGALLVHTNPLANLDSLETLIGLSKVSNRLGSEVLFVLSELFMEALIPKHRKLLQMALRGADWKALRNREDVSKEEKTKIYAYWHFEAELKEQYFEFLKNLQHCLQTGQEPIKGAAIHCATKLLCHGPEKEQLILSMLVNKLGDPSHKIAAKALHHLSNVTFQHPNMCGVITNETEKLLFRNNISEAAQHFALCFLAQIAPRGQSDVCSKLVNICFAFFKVLVKKGAVNNRTMQAILRCLQKAIVDAKPTGATQEIMSKEMQDTIYRLVHLADIQVAIQTLSLLLQLALMKGENSDRFYNALYKKMVDLDLSAMGAKCASQFFHIVHRSIHIDSNVPRAMSFIKRLLQISLYMPAHLACGSLIVIGKVLKSRPELRRIEPFKNLANMSSNNGSDENHATDVSENESIKDESDEKRKSKSSEKESSPVNYDPYHRVPAFSGAQYIDRTEFILMVNHFHPSCKVFSQSITKGKPISYYGDPLRDFSLAHFLERFAFKNPKKIESGKEEEGASIIKSLYDKPYTPQGGRAYPIQSLTKENCTEEEKFIFTYLESKRERQTHLKEKDNDVESIDDDEFDAYLDSLCKKTDALSDEEDESIDYMKEMGVDLKTDKRRPNKKKKASDTEDENDEDEADFDDWVDEEDDENASEVGDETVKDDEDDDDEGSISLNESDSLSSDEDASESGNEFIDDEAENDDSSDSVTEKLEDSEDEYEPKEKKSKKKIDSEKKFNKTLKSSDDISSLFAAADDFAELLEETSKDKRHGTASAVFNKDKSSEKQLKWEEKRRQGGEKKYFSNKKFKHAGKHKR